GPGLGRAGFATQPGFRAPTDSSATLSEGTAGPRAWLGPLDPSVGPAAEAPSGSAPRSPLRTTLRDQPPEAIDGAGPVARFPAPAIDLRVVPPSARPALESTAVERAAP